MDIPSTEELLALCRICKLESDDLEHMTYGDIIDYIDSYLEMKNPDKEQKAKKATQADIDAFFG